MIVSHVSSWTLVEEKRKKDENYFKINFPYYIEYFIFLKSIPLFAILLSLCYDEMVFFIFSMTKFIPLLTSFTSLVAVCILIQIQNCAILDISHSNLALAFPSAVMPASFVFGIWFTLIIFFLGTSVLIMRDHIKTNAKQNILYSLSVVLITLWILLWSYSYTIPALLTLLVLIGTLTPVFFGSFVSSPLFRSSVEMLLGWTFVLLCINGSILMQSLGFPYGFPGDVYFAIFSIGFVFMAISELQCRYKTYVMSGVFLWTLLGIAVVQSTLEQRVMVLIYTLVMAHFIWNSYHNKKTCINTLLGK